MRWRAIYDANKLSIKHPDVVADGLRLIIPADAQSARTATFLDPDGKRAYPIFPWVEIPIGKYATITCSRDAFWEEAAVIYEESSAASVAEYMRCGTNAWHNQPPDLRGQLQPGKRYYLSVWHKVPEERKDITDVGWNPSRVRLQVTSSGFRAEADDAHADGRGRYGDGDYNDTVITIVIR
jgi:hypothetical protein